jgi:hypothetical protein
LAGEHVSNSVAQLLRRQPLSIRQHTSAYVSVRQHASAYQLRR